jgi:hypothetical protein
VVLLIDWVLRTNPVIATTILQQPPPSAKMINDWIVNGLLDITLTDLISLGITAALVYYAYGAVEESKKQRQKDSAEKRLEKLYNPMYEILIRAEKTVLTGSDGKDYEYRVLGKSEHDRLWGIVENHSHYLRPEEYKKTKQMLSHTREVKGLTVLYYPSDYIECLAFANARRSELADWLRELSE